MRFTPIDNCPVPRSVAPAIAALKAESGSELNSCYRGDKATSLLKRLGKSTQAFLYRMWVNHVPGFNPANPPHHSTHELFSDGVAYPKYRDGMPLPRPWMVGQDWANPDAVDRAAKKLDLDLFRPYPDGREAQHRNFRTKPWIRRTLKQGTRGKDVRHLTRQLTHVRDAAGRRYLKRRYWHFTADVAIAVRHFQRDHHIKADGIVGYRTQLALRRSLKQ